VTGPDPTSRASGLSRRVTTAAVLLTIGTGATDVASFTRLGGVFTSVMTGNLVLLGLAAARTSGSLAVHTVVSIASYVLGVAIAARVIAPGRQGAGEVWPPLVTAALAVELVLLAALAAGWELAGARPAGLSQFVLQATAAGAMGLQSAAVRGIGVPDISTTYLTGSLTQLVTRLVTPGQAGQAAWPGWRLAGPLLALAAGALAGGVLIASAPAAAPVIIVAPLCAVLAMAQWPRARG
jgi:uncharacterized membrane protein YoaK (UPF0700 family)